VLRLARDKRTVQDEHSEIFTVAETSKMAEIHDFPNLYVELAKNFLKKSNISETVRNS